MQAHTQTIDPRTLQIKKQQPMADFLAAALIGAALAAGLVVGWSS